MSTSNSIKNVFQRYDKDKSGFVTVNEAHDVLKSELGYTESEARMLMKTYDRNGDGHLNYEEFVAFYSKVNDLQKELKETFKQIDKDGSGSVSFDELKEALVGFGFADQDIRDMIALYDTNKDGVLSYDEFIRFWK